MESQILKFFANQPDAQPLRASLDLDNSRQVERARDENLPAAYLIKKQDLAALKNFKELIVDRGKKDKRKALSSLLLRRKKIPLIDGNYDDPGQCKRSIRTLLANARNKGERNLYIIGAAEDIFKALWEQAGHKKETPSSTALGDERGALPRNMLDMMGPCEVPTRLSQRYIGESAAVQLVRAMIIRAAGNDHTVLILGDTGTGKEIVARAIYENGNRREERFMPVNCGGIPEDLLESELFGHVKGAFTGATSEKTGLWELAEKGTLFLDEIGDLSLHHQAKILRALEENKIRRVGGTKEISVYARVIAATNRDLYSMTQAGQFREDLYYRLRDLVIYTPSLRDHAEDIPLLAQGFWREVTQDAKKTLSPEILEELKTNRWPGNVRELKRVLNLLHSLVPTDQPKVENLRVVIFYLRHADTGQEVSLQEAGSKGIDSLNHLRRVEEVIRAASNAIDPAFKSKTVKASLISLQELIRFRLNELEMLCHPKLFHHKSMFFQVHDFRGKLFYFQNLLEKNSQDAKRSWIQDVAPGSRMVLANISKEIKALLGTT